MRHYEVTFIASPVLSSDEVKATAEHIQTEIKGFGGQIVAVDELGLRQLAYPINRRASGVYFSVEFATVVADWLGKFELNLKRNENVLRFLTVKLDKYGVKYNEDKRNGLIGKKKSDAHSAGTADDAVPLPQVVDLDA